MNQSGFLKHRPLYYFAWLLLCVVAAMPVATVSAQSTPSSSPSLKLVGKLTPQKPTASDNFGWAMAASGTTIAVGAPGRNANQGAVDIFVRNGDSWTFQTELKAGDGKPNDHFGWAVALRGDLLLVGAPYKNNYTGGIYAFAYDGKGWQPQDMPVSKDIGQGSLYGYAILMSDIPQATTASLGGVSSRLALVNLLSSGIKMVPIFRRL